MQLPTRPAFEIAIDRFGYIVARYGHVTVEIPPGCLARPDLIYTARWSSKRDASEYFNVVAH